MGVRAENWPEYPQIVIYRSPKISHESSYVVFGQKTAKIQDDRQWILKTTRLLTSNPIIKCDNFGAWNPFLDFKLHYFFISHIKVKT